MCIASLGISQPLPLGGKRFQTMAGACTEQLWPVGTSFWWLTAAITNRIIGNILVIVILSTFTVLMK